MITPRVPLEDTCDYQSSDSAPGQPPERFQVILVPGSRPLLGDVAVLLRKRLVIVALLFPLAALATITSLVARPFLGGVFSIARGTIHQPLNLEQKE